MVDRSCNQVGVNSSNLTKVHSSVDLDYISIYIYRYYLLAGIVNSMLSVKKNIMTLNQSINQPMQSINTNITYTWAIINPNIIILSTYLPTYLVDPRIPQVGERLLHSRMTSS